MNDQELIRESLRGNRKAQRAIFDRFYAKVYGTIRKYVRNTSDAEDVTIVVFDKVFQQLGRFEWRGENALSKWIHRIAVNAALKQLQKKDLLDFNGEIEEYEPFDAADDEKFSLDIPMNIIKREIDRLPKGYRTVFLLHTVDGLTHSEIAEHLSISRNTSKSQMLKARRLLLSKIKEYESRRI